MSFKVAVTSPLFCTRHTQTLKQPPAKPMNEIGVMALSRDIPVRTITYPGPIFLIKSPGEFLEQSRKTIGPRAVFVEKKAQWILSKTSPHSPQGMHMILKLSLQ